MPLLSWLTGARRAFAPVTHPIAARWRARRHVFWSTVFLGVACEVALELADGWPLVERSKRWALDAAMAIEVSGAQDTERKVPPLSFLEIDEETWRHRVWGGGEPDTAPRDALGELIEFALERNAQYVVVDIAIEHGELDRTFVSGIADLEARLKESDQHLLFVRTLRKPLDTNPRLAPEWRPSLLDGLEASGHVHAVAPFFRTSADGIAREWELWQPGCRTRDASGLGVWQMLPSVQLVVAALQLQPHLKNEALLPWMKPSRQPCIVSADALLASDTRPAAEVAKSLDDKLITWIRTQPELAGYRNRRSLPSDDGALISRVFFSLSFPPKPDQVMRVSALDVLTNSPRLANANFGHGVVVLGQSFEASRDSYTTPIGTMPGAFVILNSIRSMLSPGVLLELPWFLKYLLSALLILSFSGLYTFFGNWLGTLAISLTLVPLLIELSVALARLGYWSDYGVPVLGIALDRVIDLARTQLKEWPGSKVGQEEPVA